MIIRYKPKRQKISIEKLRQGDTFECDGKFFLIVSEKDFEGKVCIADLETGFVIAVSGEDNVVPVKIEAVAVEAL